MKDKALERRLTSSGVYEALMQIDLSKAPGPDGMTELFYQKIWCFTGNTIVNMVSSFFKVLPPNIYKTCNFDPQGFKTRVS